VLWFRALLIRLLNLKIIKMEQEKKTQLIQDFATAINKVSAENGSNGCAHKQ
jgi:hypothetical protein